MKFKGSIKGIDKTIKNKLNPSGIGIEFEVVCPKCDKPTKTVIGKSKKCPNCGTDISTDKV